MSVSRESRESREFWGSRVFLLQIRRLELQCALKQIARTRGLFEAAHRVTMTSHWSAALSSASHTAVGRSGVLGVVEQASEALNKQQVGSSEHSRINKVY